MLEQSIDNEDMPLTIPNNTPRGQSTIDIQFENYNTPR